MRVRGGRVLVLTLTLLGSVSACSGETATTNPGQTAGGAGDAPRAGASGEGGSSGSLGNSGQGGSLNNAGAGASGGADRAGSGGALVAGAGGDDPGGSSGNNSGGGDQGFAGSGGETTGAGGSAGAARCRRPYEDYTLESLGEASTDGACNNRTDLLATCSTDLVTATAVCTFRCSTTEEDRDQCVITCLQGSVEPKPTNPCAVCYADVAECISEHCVSICLSEPWGLACRQCRRDNGCSTSFVSCSGLPDPN